MHLKGHLRQETTAGVHHIAFFQNVAQYQDYLHQQENYIAFVQTVLWLYFPLFY